MEWWRKVKVLGAGAYGTVTLAHPLSSSHDQPIAVKSADCGVPFAVESLLREAGVLQHLAGVPSVLQCFGEDTSVENDRLTFNLLLEYAPFGSLEDLILRSGPMPEFTVACYASMLFRGLAGIHAQGIAHCDLKSANILVFPGECEGIGQLKIADFGLAKWDCEGYFNHSPTCEESGMRYYNRGTASTASPESVQNTESWSSGEHGFHGPRADVWSMGCIVYEMMTGKGVWEWNGSMEYLYDQILDHPIPFPGNLSPNGVDFLKCCLNRDVWLRWSAERLLEHPFIVDNLRGIDLVSENGLDLNLSPWVSTTDMFSDRVIAPPGFCHSTSTASLHMYSQSICSGN